MQEDLSPRSTFVVLCICLTGIPSTVTLLVLVILTELLGEKPVYKQIAGIVGGFEVVMMLIMLVGFFVVYPLLDLRKKKKYKEGNR